MNGWKGIETQISADGTVSNICVGTNCSNQLKDYLERPVWDNDTHGLFPVIFAAIELNNLINKEQ